MASAASRNQHALPRFLIGRSAGPRLPAPITAVRDADALGCYAPGGPLSAFAGSTGHGPQTNRTDIITVMNNLEMGIALSATGDVLRLDLGPSSSGFPNGRLLTDNVVNVMMGVILAGPSSVGALGNFTGPTANEPEAPLPKPSFPYLQAPRPGRSSNFRTAPALP
jgi:hypothetical protein